MAVSRQKTARLQDADDRRDDDVGSSDFSAGAICNLQHSQLATCTARSRRR
jgi:hypothetical protein